MIRITNFWIEICIAPLEQLIKFKLSKIMKFKKDIVEQSGKIQYRTNSRKLSSYVWWFSIRSKSFENLPNLQRLIIRNLHWSMTKSSNRWLENRANSCEAWRSTTKLPATSFRDYCCYRYRKFKVWNWRLIHRRNVFCLKLKCLNFPQTLSFVKRKGRGKFDEFRNVQLKAETRRVKTPLNSTTRYPDRVLKSRDL